ncbi:hypothetical protein NKR23_g3587 [Pleurostoma richardsiae]|uniref:BHLH domain-containing protein n=1 Tax=Pleurostoma richardsiae TaxID=41990 RepID=A0AA38RL04_9PEZI|nr:hypothetical protein NKR23_g3587 [Pleurostoma richardsiae]
MAHEGEEDRYFSYAADDVEVIAGTPSSPQFRPDVLDPLDGPQHATLAANRPTITGPNTGSNPGRRHPPAPPAYSYPSAISSARAGTRTLVPSVGPPPLTVTTAAYPPSAPYAVLSSSDPSTLVFQAGADWHSPSGNSLYGSDASSVISGHSSAGLFEGSYSQGAPPEPSFPEYIAPAHLQNASPHFDHPYPWGPGSSIDGAEPPLDSGGSLSRSFPGTFAHVPHPHRSLSESQDGEFSGPEADTGSTHSYGNPGSKRTRTSPSLASGQVQAQMDIASHITTAPGPSGASLTKQKPLSKLRSASRTSKNTVHRPSETADERKSRNSHNLVEKQYRNRLNAQFESLLDALPDPMRAPSSGAADGSGMQSFDFGEKRVSKAEVLDLARRHIQSLERERDALERERDDLLVNMGKLREAYARRDGDGRESPSDEKDGSSQT